MSYGNNAALTRRSSERELGGDNKKRATSASGLDRQSEGKKFYVIISFVTKIQHKFRFLAFLS